MTMTELETIPHGAGRRQTRSVAASLPPGWAYCFAITRIHQVPVYARPRWSDVTSNCRTGASRSNGFAPTA
jgi:hypothetical protein